MSSQLRELPAEVSGMVDSFNTRTGDVVSVGGDYSAAQITNTPAGNIAAVTVQAAINELDTEKQAAFGSQSANRVYAGPASGSASAPAFRALVANDLPAALNPTTFSDSSNTSLLAQGVGSSAVGQNSIGINGQSTFHSTTNSVDGNVFGVYGQAQITVDDTISSLSVAIGNYAVVERTGASDKGSLDFLCGLQAQVHQYGTDVAAHTNAIASFYANPTCSSGEVDEMYDILVSPAVLTGAMVGARYGIYIQPDDIGTKLNWLAGNTQLGGDSFSTPGATLDVNGTIKLSASLFLGALSADPGSPVEGQMYFNSTTKKFRGFNGTTWDNLN